MKARSRAPIRRWCSAPAITCTNADSGGVVLGLSGGIDSALTACIAVDALGRENVIGVGMPGPYSSQGSIDDAAQLARNLGIRFELVPIGDIFSAYCDSLEPVFAGTKPDVTEENIQARIRGAHGDGSV